MKRTLSFLTLGFLAASAPLAAQDMKQMHMNMPPAASPSAAAPATVHDSKLTYARDIAPILADNCQTCHRAGEGTPFSMDKYETVKMWANNIKRMVTSRRMPPWFEDGKTKKFENNRSLAQADIDKIAEWVDAGAPQGDMKDMPKPRQWVEGWSIPKPDIVLQLPKPFQVQAHGLMEYEYVIIPTGFKKDTWVQYIEAAPTDRKVVHHIVAYVRVPGSSYFRGVPLNTFFTAKEAEKFKPKAPYMVPDMAPDTGTDGKPLPRTTTSKGGGADVPSDWLVGYAPGQTPDMYKDGEAKLIPAGSDIVLELHYMPNGKATSDQSRLGLVLAKGKVTKRAMTLSADNDKFKIPPFDPNYRVDSSYTVPEDMTLVGMHAHTCAARTPSTPSSSRTGKGHLAEHSQLQLALAALV
ncbi:MAG: thiol-disulfide isomerase [Alphaproteobacteria bacterium]